MSLRSRFPKLSHEDHGNIALEHLKKKYKNENIDEVISSLRDLIDSGIYERLINVYQNWDEPVPFSSNETTEIGRESHLLVLASDNLRNAPPPFSELINYTSFYFFYPFLELVYSMNLERQLTADDVRKLFKSDIGERIVLNLEHFDEIKIVPELTSEFFQKLKKLKWKDRKTKNLNSKLERILSFYVFKNLGITEGTFNAKQNEVKLFLAGCSAVNNEKDKIDENDVFTAYKTLFKIIKTDISKLINGTPKQETSHGYLYCQECGGYYQLQPGESPDDFTDKCECGGKLKYQESIHPVKDDKNKFWRNIISCAIFGFILFFGLKMVVASLIAGAVVSYSLGGGYTNGATNGFITGSIAMILVILTTIIFTFSTQDINLELSMNFIYRLGLVIIFAAGLTLAGGLIAAFGGLFGIKIREIKEKYRE